MSLQIDLFYSFRSPYSYLATQRTRQLRDEYNVEVNVRVVLPIAVRTPEFFDRINPLWPPYLMRDVHRLAEYLEVPFRWPRPDPVVQDIATRTIAKDQPYIWRISRLGVAAAHRGRGLDFTCEAASVIWSGKVDNWHEGDHLERAAERAGLDFADLKRDLEEPEALDQVIEANQSALEKAGHWGVPTFVFEGEPFFGQDRIDLLTWRLRKKGLAQAALETSSSRT